LSKIPLRQRIFQRISNDGYWEIANVYIQWGFGENPIVCPTLTTLTFNGCRRITDISALANCVKLLYLDLRQCDELHRFAVLYQMYPCDLEHGYTMYKTIT
jgi:hypothetical protein